MNTSIATVGGSSGGSANCGKQGRTHRTGAKFTEKWDLCYAFSKHGSCKDKNCQWRHELPKKEETKEAKEVKDAKEAKPKSRPRVERKEEVQSLSRGISGFHRQLAAAVTEDMEQDAAGQIVTRWKHHYRWPIDSKSKPGGYGYGYGASRDEETSSESSSESESSDSIASEVEVESIPKAPEAVKGSTETLPKRRSVTFKEEVLILTDSAREFTKLSVRQGTLRKRFKEPPPAGKLVRTNEGGRALKSPPPERSFLGEPTEMPSLKKKRKPQESKVSEDGRKKRNRKEKSRSPDGSATGPQRDDTANAAKEQIVREEPMADADMSHVHLQIQKPKEDGESIQESIQEEKSTKTNNNEKNDHAQRGLKERGESGTRGMQHVNVVPEQQERRTEDVADPPNHAAPAVLMPTSAQCCDHVQAVSEETSQEERPGPPSKKVPWNHERLQHADLEEPRARVTSDQEAKKAPTRGIRLAEEWRPPPPLLLPKDIQVWNASEYRGTELRARAKSRQHPQRQVEEPRARVTSDQEAKKAPTRGIRLAEEWRPRRPSLDAKFDKEKNKRA
ncbi:unnamed protein product [Symbiodinium natans]|uniref:C3H1-type domain-containing protein n=1 Tax=Symbiodinium natans TaxID=878477 RepID=A0A812TIF6_9DINO|nr:unnamed protein product [Symbiodinium natans]